MKHFKKISILMAVLPLLTAISPVLASSDREIIPDLHAPFPAVAPDTRNSSEEFDCDIVPLSASTPDQELSVGIKEFRKVTPLPRSAMEKWKKEIREQSGKGSEPISVLDDGDYSLGKAQFMTIPEFRPASSSHRDLISHAKHQSILPQATFNATLHTLYHFIRDPEVLKCSPLSQFQNLIQLLNSTKLLSEQKLNQLNRLYDSLRKEKTLVLTKIYVLPVIENSATAQRFASGGTISDVIHPGDLCINLAIYDTTTKTQRNTLIVMHDATNSISAIPSETEVRSAHAIQRSKSTRTFRLPLSTMQHSSSADKLVSTEEVPSDSATVKPLSEVATLSSSEASFCRLRRSRPSTTLSDLTKRSLDSICSTQHSRKNSYPVFQAKDLYNQKVDGKITDAITKLSGGATTFSTVKAAADEPTHRRFTELTGFIYIELAKLKSTDRTAFSHFRNMLAYLSRTYPGYNFLPDKIKNELLKLDPEDVQYFALSFLKQDSDDGKYKAGDLVMYINSKPECETVYILR